MPRRRRRRGLWPTPQGSEPTQRFAVNQGPKIERLGLARIERGVNGADHQCAVPHGRSNALCRASADVADGKYTTTRALEHQRATVRPVPVSGEVRVAARLLAGDHESLVVLADVVDQA